MKKFLYLTILSTLLPLTAISEVNSFNKVNNEMRASFLIRSVNYKELSPIDHSTLDRNMGVIPGLDLTLRHTFSFIYLNLDIQSTGGKIPYYGSTFSGKKANVNNSSSFISDSYVDLGYNRSFNPYFSLTPMVRMGYHSWLRSIGSVSNSMLKSKADEENYYNGYYAGGILFQIKPLSSLVTSITALYGNTFSAWATNPTATLTPASDITSGATLKLKSKPWWLLGLDVDYNFYEHWHAFATVSYNYFQYGQSAVVNVGSVDIEGFKGFLEPHSRTFYWTSYLGLGYDLNGTLLSSSHDPIHYSIENMNNEAQANLRYNWLKYFIHTMTPTQLIYSNIIPANYYNQGPGLLLRFNKMLLKHWIISGLGTYQTNTGSVTIKQPVTYKLNNVGSMTYYQAQFGLGYLFKLNNRLGLSPGLVGGYENYAYLIQKNSPYYYDDAGVNRWYYFGPKLNLDWQMSTRFILDASMAGGLTNNNLDFSPLNQVYYHNASAPWYELILSGHYALTQTIALTADVDYRHVSFAKSKLTYPVLSFYSATFYPKASLSMLSLDLGLAYYF